MTQPMSEQQQLAEVMREINALAGDLRKTIVTISLTQPSSVRMLLDSYLRMVSPSMAKHAGAMFPVSVRTHKFNRERCSSGVTKRDLLLFHVGNAIFAFYTSVEAIKVTPEFRSRLMLLDGIAKHGLHTCKIVGAPQEGYCLSYPDHRAAKKVDDSVIPDAATPEIKPQPDSGRGGRGGSPPRVQR